MCFTSYAVVQHVEFTIANIASRFGSNTPMTHSCRPTYLLPHITWHCDSESCLRSLHSWFCHNVLASNHLI